MTLLLFPRCSESYWRTWVLAVTLTVVLCDMVPQSEPATPDSLLLFNLRFTYKSVRV
jgi:hypothetical protein